MEKINVGSLSVPSWRYNMISKHKRSNKPITHVDSQVFVLDVVELFYSIELFKFRIWKDQDMACNTVTRRAGQRSHADRGRRRGGVPDGWARDGIIRRRHCRATVSVTAGGTDCSVGDVDQ